MSDLISKEALIEEIKQRAGMWQKTAEKFISVIKEQPTVEAVPVVYGEWKEATPKGVHSWSKGYARCSACDETIWSGWEMNFCPNCGADMRKKVE